MKKTLLLFLVLCLTTILFAGGNKDSAAELKSIEVWMINNPVDAIIKAFDDAATDFEKETGVKVIFVRIPTNDFHTKLVTNVSAKMYPDVIIWNTTPGIEFSSTGAVESVSEVINKFGKDKFSENLLKMFTINDVLYEVPFLGRPAGIHARKDWLEAAGYNTSLKTDANGNYYIENLKTWEDILTAGVKMTNKTTGKYGMGFPYSRKAFGDSAGFTFSVWASYGGKYFDEKGAVAINSPETIEAFRFIKKLWDSGANPSAATTWDGNSNNQYFISGDLGIVQNSNSISGKLNNNTAVKPENLLIIPFPSGSKMSIMQASPESITLFKTKNIEASKKFAEFMLRADTQVKMFETMGFGYYSPLRKDVMENKIFQNLSQNERVLMQDSVKAAGASYPGEANSKIVALYSAFFFDDALSRIAVDGWTPEQVAAEMEKKVKDALN